MPEFPLSREEFVNKHVEPGRSFEQADAYVRPCGKSICKTKINGTCSGWVFMGGPQSDELLNVPVEDLPYEIYSKEIIYLVYTVIGHTWVRVIHNNSILKGHLGAGVCTCQSCGTNMTLDDLSAKLGFNVSEEDYLWEIGKQIRAQV